MDNNIGAVPQERRTLNNALRALEERASRLHGLLNVSSTLVELIENPQGLPQDESAEKCLVDPAERSPNLVDMFYLVIEDMDKTTERIHQRLEKVGSAIK